MGIDFKENSVNKTEAKKKYDENYNNIFNRGTEMYLSKWFSEKYQLLNSAADRLGSDENAPLYSIQLLHLDPQFKIMQQRLKNYWAMCDTGISGLYNQRPDNAEAMSPDQLIALVAHLLGVGNTGEIKRIWKYLKKHKFTYDNATAQTNFKRIMQPMCIAFVGAAAGSWFWKFVLIQACTISCKRFDATKNTDWRKYSSGVLKANTCLDALGIKIQRVLKYQYAARSVYYGNDGHPLSTGVLL